MNVTPAHWWPSTTARLRLADVAGRIGRASRPIRDQRLRRSHRRRRRRQLWSDAALRRTHERLRQGLLDYLATGAVLSLATAPIIYSLLLPLVLLDLWVLTYQAVCFPIYGIARVPRRRYFAVDRHKLAYLNLFEKLHCTFCSYANGLLAYVGEVAARTEQYWCPIKHARAIPAAHGRYHAFFDYGDAARYQRDLGRLRGALTPARARPRHAHGSRPGVHR